MPDKYLRRDLTTGGVTETPATDTSAGAADAGKIPALDSAGRLAQNMMPVGVTPDTLTANASGALSAGDFIYVTSGGLIARASAAPGGNETIGFVLAASTTGTPATAYFEGRNTGLTGLTVGAKYYLSTTVPGGVQTAVPTGAGAFQQAVGRAISASTIAFEADDQPITLA